MPKFYNFILKKSVVRFYNTTKAKNKLKATLELWNVSERAVFVWLKEAKTNKRYSENDDSAKNCKHHTLKIGRKSQFTKEMVDHLRTKILVDKMFALKSLRESIFETFNMRFSKATICNKLRENDLSRKRVIVDRYPYKQEKRNEQIKEMQTALHNKKYRNFLNVDETSVDINIPVKYGYSEKGKRCIIKKAPKNKKHRLSLVACISNKKIIAFRYNIGTFNAVKFTNYIVEDIIPNAKYVHVLVDNARIHHAKIYKAKMKALKKQNKTIYTVPYSPQFIPIELFFNDIKNDIAKQNFKTIDELKIFMDNLIATYDETKLEGYYKHALQNLFSIRV